MPFEEGSLGNIITFSILSGTHNLPCTVYTCTYEIMKLVREVPHASQSATRVSKGKLKWNTFLLLPFLPTFLVFLFNSANIFLPLPTSTPATFRSSLKDEAWQQTSHRKKRPLPTKAKVQQTTIGGGSGMGGP